jgi:hypothetical protein
MYVLLLVESQWKRDDANVTYVANQIGDDGAQALAKVLVSDCTLTSLNLGGMMFAENVT